jgi:hypothetical protein
VGHPEARGLSPRLRISIILAGVIVAGAGIFVTLILGIYGAGLRSRTRLPVASALVAVGALGLATCVWLDQLWLTPIVAAFPAAALWAYLMSPARSRPPVSA